MGEPLKGKFDSRKEDVILFYDVQSAVEWLKEQMEKRFMRKGGTLNGFQYKYGTTIELIDEAFEDVKK